jgi:hypothetical protein
MTRQDSSAGLNLPQALAQQQYRTAGSTEQHGPASSPAALHQAVTATRCDAEHIIFLVKHHTVIDCSIAAGWMMRPLLDINTAEH